MAGRLCNKRAIATASDPKVCVREENPGMANSTSKNKDSADVAEEMSSEDSSLRLGDRLLRRRV